MPRRKLPPLNALKTFEVYGRHLNLKYAADELCVSESAISRQLKHLEEYLGVKLFERVGRNNQLTDAGQEYLLAISDSFGDIAEKTQLLFPNQTTISRKKLLRLGVNSAIAEYWLTPRLPKFQSQFPEITLEIYLNRSQTVDTPLEDVDAEIYAGQITSADYIAKKLFRIHDFPVCNPSLLLGGDAIDSLDKLMLYPKLHEASYHWWPEWQKAVGYAGKSNNQGILVFDECLPIKLAEQGIGVAIGDHLSCFELLNKGQLVRPVKDMMITDDWINLLTKANHRQSSMLQSFEEWLTQEMCDFIGSLPDYVA